MVTLCWISSAVAAKVRRQCSSIGIKHTGAAPIFGAVEGRTLSWDDCLLLSSWNLPLPTLTSDARIA